MPALRWIFSEYISVRKCGQADAGTTGHSSVGRRKRIFYKVADISDSGAKTTLDSRILESGPFLAPDVKVQSSDNHCPDLFLSTLFRRHMVGNQILHSVTLFSKNLRNKTRNRIRQNRAAFLKKRRRLKCTEGFGEFISSLIWVDILPYLIVQINTFWAVHF